ncbi:MAG: hypothetical protein ACRD3E_15630 [Terriglobales bacterium]
MEVKALVLVGGAVEGAAENFAGTPLAVADVLGHSAVYHLVEHLRRQSVTDVAIISDFPAASCDRTSRRSAESQSWMLAPGAQLWRAAETAFNDLAQSGAEEILVIRVGAYVEPDVDDLLQAHIENRTHATRAVDEHGEPMDLLVVTASRRNEAAYAFRHALSETRTRCGSWRFRGYANPLRSAQDLRCLAVDAFLGENGIVPDGIQVRPGVWVARGAAVHPRARVLAPAFIGRRARVRANAVLTRCSVVERHADIGVGTVIEDASVLPFTCVGAGLDVVHAVTGSGRLASLEHDVEIEISDPRLLRSVPYKPGWRALALAASALSFLLPSPVSQRLARSGRMKSAELPEAVASPSALHTPAGFPAGTSAVQVSSRTWQ